MRISGIIQNNASLRMAVDMLFAPNYIGRYFAQFALKRLIRLQDFGFRLSWLDILPLRRPNGRHHPQYRCYHKPDKVLNITLFQIIARKFQRIKFRQCLPRIAPLNQIRMLDFNSLHAASSGKNITACFQNALTTYLCPAKFCICNLPDEWIRLYAICFCPAKNGLQWRSSRPSEWIQKPDRPIPSCLFNL